MIDQKLFDAVLANAIDVLRLSAHERAQVAKRLKEMEKELLRRMAEESLTIGERARLAKVIRDCDDIIEQAYKSILGGLPVRGIAEMVADHTAEALYVVFGLDSIGVPTKDYFKSLASDILIQGAPSADWWRGQSENIKLKFSAQLRQGLANGETNQQITARIVGKAGVPGVMDIARRDAASLVHTSVQTVANDARRQTFKSNDDIVKGIRQVSTLDSHTSLTCVAYSGESWNMDFEPLGPKKLPYNGGTPRHFLCRSVEVPITKTFKELGIDIPEAPGTTRASSSGQIEVNTSFNDYLERMGTKYQNKVLGEGRAELWRKGKITLKDLVDGQGRPVSLEYLHNLVAKRTEVDINQTAKDYVLSNGKDGKEYLFAFDDKTKRIVAKTGGIKNDNVTLDEKISQEFDNKLNSIVVHHNHPGGDSLSSRDIWEVSNRVGMKGIWAHVEDGSSYYAEKTKKVVNYKAIEQAKKYLNKEFSKVVSNKYQLEDLQQTYWHIFNLYMNKKGYINYDYKLDGNSLKVYNRVSNLIDLVLK